MYLFFLNLLSLLTHPRFYLREHSLVAFSRLSLRGGGRLQTNRTVIRKSTISIEGNNLINLRKADIFNSSIRVLGAGNTVHIHDAVRIYNTTIIIKKARGGYIEIGEGTHISGATIVCTGNGNYITIGKECAIAECVDIWNSDTHVITIQGQEQNNTAPIQIQDRVWIGKGVTVLKGVTIGYNSIVGMKSVVTHDIRPGTINAGVPAKEIKDNVSWHK